MKKIILALLLINMACSCFAQKTSLDYLKTKLKESIQNEIVKYDYFGPVLRSYPNSKFKSISILDVTSKEDKLNVVGEFSCLYGFDKNTDYIIKSIKFQATVKQILDDFSVIEVMYQNNSDKQWYQLFPASDFN
ncbi:hypothetical protein [Pedobacter alpinus]|uniref:Uncharacterized protein n=1 Tax=Pedobacter alpinus TaxID=1590643 RepID=A0ABW5TS77_9SPHI